MNNQHNNKTTAEKIAQKRPLVFLAVGVINTLLDFLFYTLLTQTVFSSNIALAGFVSGTVALVIAFLNHAFITWRGASIDRQTPVRFFIVTGFGMWVLRPALLWLFTQPQQIYEWLYSISSSMGLPFSLDFITKTGAFGCMVIIVLIYNYFTYDRFVFRTKTDTPQKTN